MKMHLITIALLIAGSGATAHAEAQTSADQQPACAEMIKNMNEWIAVRDMSQSNYYQDPSANNKSLRIGLGFKVRALMTDVNAACGTNFAQSPGEPDPR